VSLRGPDFNLPFSLVQVLDGAPSPQASLLSEINARGGAQVEVRRSVFIHRVRHIP